MQTLTRGFTRARRGCVIQRCQKFQIGIETRGCGWRHAPEAWAEIWEKAVSWVPVSERKRWDLDLGEARRLCALRAPRVGWVESWRCKSSQHRKICVSLSSCRKPLNSKRWIKVSYLNQFRVFGFLYMFMNILWTLCLFHISVSWVCYNFTFPKTPCLTTHHQMQFSVICRTLIGGGLISQQKCSRRIL